MYKFKIGDHIRLKKGVSSFGITNNNIEEHGYGKKGNKYLRVKAIDNYRIHPYDASSSRLIAEFGKDPYGGRWTLLVSDCVLVNNIDNNILDSIKCTDFKEIDHGEV